MTPLLHAQRTWHHDTHHDTGACLRERTGFSMFNSSSSMSSTCSVAIRLLCVPVSVEIWRAAYVLVRV